MQCRQGPARSLLPVDERLLICTEAAQRILIDRPCQPTLHYALQGSAFLTIAPELIRFQHGVCYSIAMKLFSHNYLIDKATELCCSCYLQCVSESLKGDREKKTVSASALLNQERLRMAQVMNMRHGTVLPSFIQYVSFELMNGH